MADEPGDVTVPALAAQLADLRHKVIELNARVTGAGTISSIGKVKQQFTDLTAQVTEHAGQLTAIIGQLGALSEQVTELAGQQRAASIAAPNWLDLTPEEYAAQLAALRQWAGDVLTPNYLTTPLRPCWLSHMPAVWELSTLRAEWTRVYARERPDLAAALTWNDRWLPGVRARLEHILKDCKASCALAKSQAPAQVRPRAV